MAFLSKTENRKFNGMPKRIDYYSRYKKFNIVRIMIGMKKEIRMKANLRSSVTILSP